MNLLDIDLIELFIEKFGDDVFKDIVKIIKKENDKNVEKDYIEIIFDIAFYNHLGLSNKEIIKLTKNSNIDNLKQIHKKSILKIQKYFSKAMNDGMNNLNINN